MKISARGLIVLGLLVACLLKGGGAKAEPEQLPDLVIAAQ